MARPTEWVKSGKVYATFDKLKGSFFTEGQLVERRIEEIKELANQLVKIYNTNGGNITRKDLTGILEKDEYTALTSCCQKINDIKISINQKKDSEVIYKVG